MTDNASSGSNNSALILLEYENDWLAPNGGINGQFQDREQFDTAIAHSKKILDEARPVAWKSFRPPCDLSRRSRCSAKANTACAK